MTDLFSVMSKLVDTNGKILVPGIYEQVRALSGKFILGDYSKGVVLICKIYRRRTNYL